MAEAPGPAPALDSAAKGSAPVDSEGGPKGEGRAEGAPDESAPRIEATVAAGNGEEASAAPSGEGEEIGGDEGEGEAAESREPPAAQPRPGLPPP